MKKTIFLLGLFTTAICLSACWWRKYEMSFDEALDVVSHSALQDILSNNESIEQNFDVATNVDKNESKIIASIQTNSKQNTQNKNFDSSTQFDVNINNKWESMKIDWNLALKLVDKALYLNLESLNFTWSDDASFLASMVEWFKNQWYSVPMSGLNEISEWYFTRSNDLNKKAKEIIINEWSSVYNWKFTDFNWYNAWKFSLDNNKLQEIINEYYSSISEEDTEIPQLKIENFEWYLVITWKNKVTVVIENMDMIDEGTTINVNWFGGENYTLNLSNEWEEVIVATANKNGSHYDIYAKIWNLILINWTINPKLSKSSIKLNFDIVLTIKSEYEWETDTTIPLKGNRSYEPTSQFSISVPSESQDLTEMIEWYLWSMFGTWEYNYEDYDYDDEYTDDENLNDEILNETNEEINTEMSIDTINENLEND